MSAKEMFEELGYEQTKNNNDYVIYENDDNVKYKICFLKHSKAIELEPTIRGKMHYFTRVDMRLLQAINKQVDELEWNK